MENSTNQLLIYSGIIDSNNNPFYMGSWIKNKYPCTPHRMYQLIQLFGLSIERILSLPRNEGQYPAFVGIRWGFAKLLGGNLIATDKWEKRQDYDGYGRQIIISGSKKNQSQRRPITRKLKVSDQKLDPNPGLFKRNELIKALKLFRAEPVIKDYISNNNLNRKTEGEILDFAFGNSIKRAFQHETPGLRYNKWRWYKAPDILVETLNAMKMQEDFDKFVSDLGESLVKDWGDTNNLGQPTRMNIGVAMKIINLIIKPLAYSKHCNNPLLKEWLHVPWDKFTLGPLTGKWKENLIIPQSPRMGFVNNRKLYDQLHSLISEITKEAGVSRITYEFWAWDSVHYQAL